MVILLNLLLGLIIGVVMIGGYLVYKRTKSPKVAPVVVSLVCLIVIIYGNVQPSYMPKGTVPSMDRVPYDTEEYELQDLTVKPLSKEDSQKRLDKILTVRDEVKEIIEKGEKK